MAINHVGALSLRQSGTSCVLVCRYLRSASANNDKHRIITYHAAAGKTRRCDAESLNCGSPKNKKCYKCCYQSTILPVPFRTLIGLHSYSCSAHLSVI